MHTGFYFSMWRSHCVAMLFWCQLGTKKLRQCMKHSSYPQEQDTISQHNPMNAWNACPLPLRIYLRGTNATSSGRESFSCQRRWITVGGLLHVRENGFMPPISPPQPLVQVPYIVVLYRGSFSLERLGGLSL